MKLQQTKQRRTLDVTYVNSGARVMASYRIMVPASTPPRNCKAVPNKVTTNKYAGAICVRAYFLIKEKQREILEERGIWSSSSLFGAKRAF